MTNRIVLDASALVDLLADGPHIQWVVETIRGAEISAPAHLPAEVLSALGRRTRAGVLTPQFVDAALRRAARMRLTTHAVSALLLGAWERRDNLRLADALYVELAAQLDTVVITTDQRLARATSLAVAPPFDHGRADR